MNATRRPTLVEMITDLCDTTTHREPYQVRRRGGPQTRYHITTNPPLILQLLDAVDPSRAVEGAGHRRPGSSPAANLDAIDTAIRIDTEARALLHTNGLDPRWDTITVIRRLTEGETTADPAQLERTVNRWWTWARTATSWDTPPWQPDNTCPLCGTRGTVRIRRLEQIATCINDTCRETWNPDTIGLLADHIRHENEHAPTDHRFEPCTQHWCNHRYEAECLQVGSNIDGTRQPCPPMPDHHRLTLVADQPAAGLPGAIPAKDGGLQPTPYRTTPKPRGLDWPTTARRADSA